MKGFILAMMLAFSGAASAETITLGPDNCGTLKQCISIPNDAAADVSFYGSTASNAGFTLYINGVQYSAQTGDGFSIVSVPAVAADGSVALLSANFTTYRTCVRSGRGQHCNTHWQLTDGTIVR